MVTIRLFSLDGYTLVRFEAEPPPESPLWTDLGALTMRRDELKAFLAQVQLVNARVTFELQETPKARRVNVGGAAGPSCYTSAVRRL